jgi:BirA family biotin operon repressor/biotin-[acetyl-CoA-carboxylase] ligase
VTDRLDADRIAGGVLPALQPVLRRVTVLEEIDSTNAALARLPAAERHAHALLAETQTAGRGRSGRGWHSPPGANIYLSLGWRLRAVGPALSALPLAIAVAVAEALAAAGLENAGIKWPNDILVGGRKLAGILVESQGQAGSDSTVVAGIGLNVRMTRVGAREADAAIDRPWTDLESELPAARCPVERNVLASGTLSRLLAAFGRFEQSGFESFGPRYARLDLLDGRSLVLEHASGAIDGTGRGVDDQGRLRLELPTGEMRTFHSGEVRIFTA